MARIILFCAMGPYVYQMEEGKSTSTGTEGLLTTHMLLHRLLV